MDETRRFRVGLVCLAATCLVAVAVLLAGEFASPQRLVWKNINVARPHHDPLKVLLRGILL